MVVTVDANCIYYSDTDIVVTLSNLYLYNYLRPSLLTLIWLILFCPWCFASEVSLVQDGAVGARVIQASTHVRLGGGVLSNSSPQPVIRDFTQIGGDFLA